MNDLLNNPAIQSGAIPLLLGLALAFALARTRFLAAVPWAAFIVVVALAVGFAFEPLTLIRKLVLVGLVGGAVALALDAAHVRAAPAVRAALAVVAALAALWMLSRVLAQKEGAELWLAGAGVAIYAAALTFSLLLVAADTLRASVSATVVGVASGALGLLGATASMTQMGIALGAASGAVVLVQMMRGERAPLGWFLAFPVALVCGMIGAGATLTGGLPWLALLPMPLVAVAARFTPIGNQRPVWFDAIVSGLAALVPAALAVALGWMRAGASAN